MSLTLVLWKGKSAGVRTGRRYDVDSNNKFKDFFGSRRCVEEGIWRRADGSVLVGSKAYKRLGVEAQWLLQELQLKQEGK